MKNDALFDFCSNVLVCENTHKWNVDEFLNGKDLSSKLKPTLCKHCEAIFNATHHDVIYAKRWINLRDKIKLQVKKTEV